MKGWVTLDNKTVLLGVTGGIAIYKAVNITSMLRKMNYNVQVVMTKNALEFVTPLTFETMSGNSCVVDQFELTKNFEVEHIALAKKADLLLIAPATANIIAKLAHGIADDALTTQALACRCPKIIAPAMNTAMYENPITQDNIEILRKYGFIVIPPATGMLACKDIGIGKLPDEETIVAYVERELSREKDYIGKKVLVTAGATQESIDPVRYITNHSTGTMGYTLAHEFMLRGAEVTLVTAPTSIKPPMFVKVVDVVSALDMYTAVIANSQNADIIVKAAAVADYTPETTAENKIKKSDKDLSFKVKRTKDILAYLGEHKTKSQFLCGFSMETENLVENSRKKLINKNLDMIVANNLKTAGAGFGTDTNAVTIISAISAEELPLMSKDEVAKEIADRIIKRI
ncbi:MAG: bifunctional phosphopantothenoylcysteine decarboxylase/phosphopantothenate--cysteine ligase CoaBC [Oscillospiraceae bacterium]